MAEERVQRRLAAILAADVVGYSRLTGADEAGTRARFNNQFDDIIQPAITDYRGRLVKTMGDGFLVEFGSVVDAVQCATDIQNTVVLRENKEPNDRKMLFRMGIHLGDVIVEGDDIHGDGVNIASRLEALADPGGICVSDMVYAGIRNKLEMQFSDLGEQTLKNILEPVTVYAAVIRRDQQQSSGADEAIFRRPAVAVLPFENLSKDSDYEHFADGLTEDIITALSQWRYFPVISRNSTFAYKGRSPDIRTVGEELGARYVIEGSVRCSGKRIRVTAQLINASNGHHVWAERYDRDITDIFDMQDELTERIAATVAPEIDQADHRRQEPSQSRNLDAWECLQQGLVLLNDMTPEGTEQARDLFAQAVKIDPGYCRAYTELAHGYHRDLFLGITGSREETLEKLFEAAKKAVAADNTDSSAHYVLALTYQWAENPELAYAEAQRAVELNPINASAQAVFGAVLSYANRFEEGIAHLRRAIHLNPKHPRVYIYLCHLADAELCLGQYEAAINHAREAIAHRSDYLEAHVLVASAAGYAGLQDDLKKAADACEQLNPNYFSEVHRWRNYRDDDRVKLVLEGFHKLTP